MGLLKTLRNLLGLGSEERDHNFRTSPNEPRQLFVVARKDAPKVGEEYRPPSVAQYYRIVSLERVDAERGVLVGIVPWGIPIPGKRDSKAAAQDQICTYISQAQSDERIIQLIRRGKDIEGIPYGLSVREIKEILKKI